MTMTNVRVTLLPIVLAVTNISCDTTDMEQTEKLIKALRRLQTATTAVFLRKRASEDDAGNIEPWRGLQHHSSRLLAYQRAVDVLWEAGCMWPRIFDSFEVTCIPSSNQVPKPLGTNVQTASEIISRMPSTSTDPKEKYLDLATHMQETFKLDEYIAGEWTRTSLRPIVHAELLVHNWMESTGGTRSERFFQGWQYIGCSKPACKLCYYYFSTHPGGVQIRGTHDNLYGNWRLPDYADVYGLSTKEAQAKRLEIAQGIMLQLKQCVTRALDEKTSDSRRCDSRTLSLFRKTGRFNCVRSVGIRMSTSQTWTVCRRVDPLNKHLAKNGIKSTRTAKQRTGLV